MPYWLHHQQVWMQEEKSRVFYWMCVNTAATPSPTPARHPPPHASVHELMASVFGEMSEESDSAVSDEGSDKDCFPTSAYTL